VFPIPQILEYCKSYGFNFISVHICIHIIYIHTRILTHTHTHTHIGHLLGVCRMTSPLPLYLVQEGKNIQKSPIQRERVRKKNQIHCRVCEKSCAKKIQYIDFDACAFFVLDFFSSRHTSEDVRRGDSRERERHTSGSTKKTKNKKPVRLVHLPGRRG
jgi:hypothetical protein